MQGKVALINKYLTHLQKASTEQAKKELLKDLLLRLFDTDKRASEVIDKMSLGSEKTVFNIQLKNRVKTGAADTQYDTVIIEFEKDMRKTGVHAIDQLAEYLVGNWNSKEGYNYILIATDCTTWKVYAPSYEKLKGKKRLKFDDIKLFETDSFVLSEKNLEEFYYFLDQYLFREQKIQATLKNIQHSFGESSATFLSCIRQMTEHFETIKDEAEVKVAYEEWYKFLSIAYGSFDGSKEVFLVHTYLSIFSKMLAFTVLSHDDYLDEREIRGIIKGDIFHQKFNIENFVEDDFYHWVAMENNFHPLKQVFRKIAQTLGEFDYNNVDQDVLKGVYQELIDLDTRHTLGEYYTPDWLCEKIVDRSKFKKNSFILDPACGSGSFLRAAVAKLKKSYPDLPIEQIANQVNGIDIHPLSVQIAKTNLLLALGKDVIKARTPVQLKIFLANTLFAPEGTVGLFGSNYDVHIDQKTYPVNTKVFDDARLFDIAINICDSLAESSKGNPLDSITTFSRFLEKHYTAGGLTTEIKEGFFEIYKGLKHAKESGRDSIWKFILQNSYKPFFLKNKFDFVIGNPPWLTYASVVNKDYQNRLSKHAKGYNLTPDGVAYIPHLEIAAIFLSHCSSYFLRDNGEISFVLPYSFINVGQHDNTRSGRALGFAIKEIWDLEGVSPLFRILSCVIIANQSRLAVNKPNPQGIKGYIVDGKLKKANSTWKEVKEIISFTETLWYYSKLKKNSAFTNQKIKSTGRANYYKEYFKQGATIVPRNFYFVDITQEYHGDLVNRHLFVKTADGAKAEAKMPWKKIELEGKVHSSFLFYTALAKNVVPFGLISLPLIVLPIKVGTDKRIQMLKVKEIKSEGHVETATWFEQVEKSWNKKKTERSDKMTFLDRLDFQRGLSGQNLNAQYLVIYTASAKDANAVVINREDYRLEFIADHKTYVFYTDDLKEAHFIASYLNSAIPNELMKSFQSRGHFGPRDVHKKILDTPFPKFDGANKIHLELAELGKEASTIIQGYIDKEVNGTEYNVGRIRLAAKKLIQKNFLQIDKIVKRLTE